jgi:hypothetical protein
VSQVCPDGHDEDWRAEGPVVVLTTSEWCGARFEGEANSPAAQTPFVLYGDGTAIACNAGAALGRWKCTKYHRDSKAVSELKNSLDWPGLLALDDHYTPIPKEQTRWQASRSFCDGCRPQLELHLWSEGCRKTISIDGIDTLFLQLLFFRSERSDLSSSAAERHRMARLAYSRLPAQLRHALERMVRFRSKEGVAWCQGAACFTHELPWHKAWGNRTRILEITSPSPPSEQKAPER